MGNYIKIDRKILEWEWYNNTNTKTLFLHMLLKANWKEGKFEGKVVARGSFISSIQKLSIETGLSQREVRTAIQHLKATGELTVKTTNRYSVFTIKNYCLYQGTDKQSDNQTTFEKQTDDSQTTTIEEGKNIRKEKKIKVSKDTDCQTGVQCVVNERKKIGKKSEVSRHKYGDYNNVLLSDEQLLKLKSEFPYDWQTRINNLSYYMQSTGKSYKDHLATIRSWAKKDTQERKGGVMDEKENTACDSESSIRLW